MPVTPLFAAVFGLVYVGLSIAVVRIRFAQKISLGSADNKDLEIAMRVHGNFAEYVPLCLLIFWFLETITMSSGLVFWLGSALLVSRVAHVFGMKNQASLLILRQIGVVGTFAVLFVASLALLWWYVPVSI